MAISELKLVVCFSMLKVNMPVSLGSPVLISSLDVLKKMRDFCSRCLWNAPSVPGSLRALRECQGRKNPCHGAHIPGEQCKSLNVIGVVFNAKGKSRKKQAMGLSMLCRMGKALR